MIDKILIISFLLIVTIHDVFSMKEWMRPFIPKKGLFNAKKGDPFHVNYTYSSPNDPVEVFCMLRGDDNFLPPMEFTSSENFEFRHDLIEALKTPSLPLTVYIDGMGVDGKEYNGISEYVQQNTLKAQEWGRKAEYNICYITFSYKNKEKTVWGFGKDVRKIAKSSRLEFIARIAYQLIVQVYADRIESIWKDVFLVGFSYGAHMIAHASRYLTLRHSPEGMAEPRKLHRMLALDAGNVELCIGTRIINSSDAVLVQVIHTEPSRSGLFREAGTVDIFVIEIPEGFPMHYVAPYIHELTSRGICKLFASLEGTGTGRAGDPHDENDVAQPDEVEVGVYNHDGNKRGKHILSYTGVKCILFNMHAVKIRKENDKLPMWYEFWKRAPFKKTQKSSSQRATA